VKPETLEGYFYDQLQDTNLDGDVRAYLVMTLTRWAVSEPDTTTALGLDYLEAHHQGSWKFRDVGDKALYLSSVRHQDPRRVVSLQYVEDVGVSSYSHFAEQTKSRSFWELAQSFHEASCAIMDLLGSLDPQTMVKQAQKGSQACEETLARMGVLLFEPRR